jgi:cation-transporting ATPase E
LVLTVTVSLVLGALVISRRQTLVQRTNAVESLANVSVLCFDKTGTLTRNKLAVTEIIPLNGHTSAQIDEKLHAYTVNLAHQNKTAAAIAQHTHAVTTTPPAKLQEVPFTSARKWGAIVMPTETLYLGAPERVLDASRNESAVTQALGLAQQGMRVLALSRSATAPQDGKIDPAREPMALVVMSDQVREDIADTLNAFRQVGVDLKVISGDNAETVGAIATAAGMPVTRAYTGDQLERMSGAELESAVREANLFARIEPETKRKIIRTLKGQGSYVAMVGDGVNDVPALKEAHMAIAMNDGAQIAKDVADVVLLNNAMSTLPLAFHEGKDITRKILATARLFLTKNFYTILTFIFVGFMTLPFPTNPIQISWLTFGAVNIPALLITFSLIKPLPMRDFSKDVVPYITAAIAVGALVASGLYTLLYLLPQFGVDPAQITRELESASRDAARCALLIFMQLYGTVVFWHTHGIDLLNPATLLERWRTVLLSLVILGLALAAPWLARDGTSTDLFTWVDPTPRTWLIVIGAWLLAVVLLNLGLRNDRLMRIVDISRY